MSVIPDVLYIYRIRQGSKMEDVSLQRKKDMLTVANRLAAFFIPKHGFDKAVAYRVVTHHYQAVLMNASKAERPELNGMCDWRCYRKVSRTKVRHVVNYWINQLKAL